MKYKSGYPTACEYLGQVRDADRRVEHLKERVMNLRMLTTDISVHYTDMPHSDSPDQQKILTILAQIDEMEREIEEAEASAKATRLDVGLTVCRLQMVSEVIRPVETLEEAMDAMKPIMWRNETLWIGESYRVTDGSRLHPYNQIVFQDDKGNRQMDWRGEYVYIWPVMDDGRMIISAEMYDQAKKSTYDPKIKEYFDDAVKHGRLVIDDGSFTYPVNGKPVKLDELSAKFDEYEACSDPEKRAELKPFRDAYWHLRINLTDAWAHDDYNFEAMKAAAYAKLHTRFNAEGRFDPNSMSQYEKLLAFYGYGREKDEKPLRDDASIWTTSLNVGTNCAQKRIKIRFWEDDNVIFEAGF